MDIFGIVLYQLQHVQHAKLLVAHVVMQQVVLAVLMNMPLMELLVPHSLDARLLLVLQVLHVLHAKMDNFYSEELVDYYQT